MFFVVNSAVTIATLKNVTEYIQDVECPCKRCNIILLVLILNIEQHNCY